MKLHRGPKAYAKVPRSPAGFLDFSKIVLVKVKGGTALKNVDTAAYEADVDELDAAHTKAKDKSPAAVADRNAKAAKVYRHILKIVQAVQDTADAQTNDADAIAIIVGAGLDVKKTTKGMHTKPELGVKHTGISGEVLLVALAIAGAGAYYWEYSVDPQQGFTTVPETTGIKTTIAGLVPGKVYYFRVRALTPKGKSEYSQVVSLMVH